MVAKNNSFAQNLLPVDCSLNTWLSFRKSMKNTKEFMQKLSPQEFTWETVFFLVFKGFFMNRCLNIQRTCRPINKFKGLQAHSQPTTSYNSQTLVAFAPSAHSTLTARERNYKQAGSYRV